MDEINAHVGAAATIVDATIEASTKNRAGERDPEMHQAKKGNQWHFGMIGVDADTGIVHSMSATAANVHDVTEAHNLLHGARRWCGVSRVSGGPEGEPGPNGGWQCFLRR